MTNRILKILKACPAAALVQENCETGHSPLARLIDRPSGGEKTPPELIEAFVNAAPFSLKNTFKPIHIGATHTNPQDYLLSRAGTPERTFRALLKGCPNQFNIYPLERLSFEKKLLVVESFVKSTFDLEPSYTAKYTLHAVVLCPMS
eukprot:CAMPEP_0194057400 /NCGR_PEP_ID=MMETSP0009_2-20130614/63282_1 /TAXON_ID=210454 /ORGANISM="Grammatophora oceanica, Strain CCMP 410" /LENGTH=146 /DNA_ID=CAMNT_0038707147 /DNA_START=191 /DNA_END=628 /DNA_ORIENTATION=+